MDYQSILARIQRTVAPGSYLTATSHLPAPQRAALDEVLAALHAPSCDPERVRTTIERLAAEGKIDRVMRLSALGVLAASPHVKDYAEAARLAEQQELAALDLRGDRREAYLASAERHRGVLAFLLGRHAVALEWFTRALERERSAQNLANVLSTLLRLGENDEALALVARVRSYFPPGLAEELEGLIAEDDDLALLR